MPIHDQSYRRYAGPRLSPARAWRVVAATGLRSLLRKKLFMAVMLFSWAQFVIRSVMIYVSATVPQMDVLAASTETFRSFFEQQGLFVFVVTVYAGAGLIATDRRVHALQIYLAKPLTRTEYIAGKFAILLVVLLAVTWLPAMLLLVVQVMFAGSLDFLSQNLFVIPAITCYGLLYASTASLAMLALSSLSTSARYAGVLYAGALLFTQAMFDVFRGATGSTALSWVSFGANLSQVGDIIFQMSPRYETPWVVSLIVIVSVIAASLWVLERRVRGVEVVA